MGAENAKMESAEKSAETVDTIERVQAIKEE
jgi:hypothetical protein